MLQIILYIRLIKNLKNDRCLVGLQGSLLSYIMEPIFISHYYIATPSDDKAVAHAVLLRWRDARKSDLVVKSSHEGTVPHGEMYHNWIAGIGEIIANMW